MQLRMIFMLPALYLSFSNLLYFRSRSRSCQFFKNFIRWICDKGWPAIFHAWCLEGTHAQVANIITISVVHNLRKNKSLLEKKKFIKSMELHLFTNYFIQHSRLDKTKQRSKVYEAFKLTCIF